MVLCPRNENIFMWAWSGTSEGSVHFISCFSVEGPGQSFDFVWESVSYVGCFIPTGAPERTYLTSKLDSNRGGMKKAHLRCILSTKKVFSELGRGEMEPSQVPPPVSLTFFPV